MLYLIPLIYGLAGSTASLAPYLKKLKKKYFWEVTHEKIIFDCCKKAFNDVTGENLEKFRLKGAVAVLQKVDQYLTTGDMQAASTTLGDFFNNFNIDIKELQERFELHLIESNSLEVLTKIHLVTSKDTKEIKQVVYKIYERLGKNIPPDVSAALAGIPTLPNPYFAHPYPLQKNFTGRMAERMELTEWFTNSPEPMFAYVAMGGMGKSALTWHWVHKDIIDQELAPAGIIWWSFYDREARFESFLPKAIQYVSKGKIDPKTIDSTRDRMDCLHQLFRDNPFLVVLDGAERVLREYAGLGSPYKGDEAEKDEKEDYRGCVDPNVGTFLQWLCSGNPQTKTLITSRLCPRELDGIAGCFCKDLTKMGEKDAVYFFRRQGVTEGTRAEIETVCQFYGYHPLTLRLLSAMIVKDPKSKGDIDTWTRHNPLPNLTGEKRKHHILELAYSSLDEKKQTLISKVSAFRNPMEYDSISIFNEFETEQEFDQTLIELQNRGLLLTEEETNRYDLHPIVRRYCYDKLLDKKGVHSQLRDYFAKVPTPDKVESLDDLAPVIELYYHTANSERYDAAIRLYGDKLSRLLYYQFGVYQLAIDLLRALIPEGEDRAPRLKEEGTQAWALNELGNCYALSGQPKKAVTLFDSYLKISSKRGDKANEAVALANLASMAQIPLGELKSAESNLRQSIELGKEIEDEYEEAASHQELGRLLSYQGRFEGLEKELAKSTKYFEKTDHIQGLCLDETYCAIRTLLMSDANSALKAAKKARELAEVQKFEADIIQAEWLLGAAYLAKGDLSEAERHLEEALRRDRKINLVEFEPDILLELAKLRFIQKRKKEALERAQEALEIADRCEYRLKQADIHNFLAEFYLDKKDFSKAKEHADIARERAECGYKPALDKAKKLAILVKEKSKQ